MKKGVNYRQFPSCIKIIFDLKFVDNGVERFGEVIECSLIYNGGNSESGRRKEEGNPTFRTEKSCSSSGKT